MAAAEDDRIDPAVVAALYARHSEELHRFLMGLLHDGQLAADVLQSAFAKMVEKGHQAAEQSRKAWLFRVAYHEAMLVRRRQATGQKAVNHLAHMGRAGPESADDVLIRLETVQRVRQALDALPPKQRQIVRMRIYEGKTFATIAQELQIPLATATARMRSALKKLKKALETPA